MTQLIDLAPGTVFARDFKVERPLSEGGMGAVYVVEQLSTGKHRALKVMHPRLVSDARSRERFTQEARIGAQIDSENVVEVVAAGVDEATGTPWLAMELLEGQDLAAAITQRGRFSPADAREVMDQLCDALGRAHARGIIHRDLKPENLYLAAPRRRGVPFVVKILDFGIARLVQDTQAGATATSAIGSPLWMAPEQAAAGSKHRPATDVWALGLITFQLLTGHSYWLAANAPPDTFNLQALFVEVMVNPVVPASARAADLGCGGLLPEGFDAWFARCVDREPTHRFNDATETYAALAPLLGTVPAAPTAPGYAATQPMAVMTPVPLGIPHGVPGTVPWQQAQPGPAAVVPGSPLPPNAPFAPGDAPRTPARRGKLIAGVSAGVVVALLATAYGLQVWKSTPVATTPQAPLPPTPSLVPTTPALVDTDVPTSVPPGDTAAHAANHRRPENEGDHDGTRAPSHPMDHPMDHPVDHPMDHPVDHPVDRPVDHPGHHPVDHPPDNTNSLPTFVPVQPRTPPVVPPQQPVPNALPTPEPGALQQPNNLHPAVQPTGPSDPRMQLPPGLPFAPGTPQAQQFQGPAVPGQGPAAGQFAPGGATEQDLARRAAMLRQGGDQPGAAEAMRQYLNRFPNGPRAPNYQRFLNNHP